MLKDITIVVEGANDKEFLEYYIKNVLNLDIEKIEFIINGGKHFNSNTTNKLNPCLDNEIPIFIIIDSDDEGYTKSVDNTIKEYSNFSITKEKIFVFPNNKDNGCLETLLLELIKSNGCEISDCLDSFAKCLSNAIVDNTNIKTPHYKYVLSICLDLIIQDNKTLKKRAISKLETYNNNGIWDWNHSSLEPLKNFLTNCIKPIK